MEGGVMEATKEEEARAEAATARAAAVRAEAARAAAAWPVELSVKEGVCHAYMGDLPTAEQLWGRVLRHPERTGNLADLLYEIALCYFHLQQWSQALPLLHALRNSELYR